jgi:hypothetical protein
LIFGGWDILIVVAIVVLLAAVGIYFFNKWASKRMSEQQDAVERNKQTVTVYIIDKKKDRITSANFPKAVQDQMPKWSRIMKMPLVKAKIGPQIMTLLCDGKIFPVLPIKKNVSVELAGMYIVGMKGMKTKKEMLEMRRKNKKGAPVESNMSVSAGLRAIFGRFFNR